MVRPWGCDVRNPRGRTTHLAAATAAAAQLQLQLQLQLQPSRLFFVPPFARWAFPIFLFFLRKTSAGAAAATAAAPWVGGAPLRVRRTPRGEPPTHPPTQALEVATHPQDIGVGGRVVRPWWCDVTPGGAPPTLQLQLQLRRSCSCSCSSGRRDCFLSPFAHWAFPIFLFFLR